jgi:hypothetical protein
MAQGNRNPSPETRFGGPRGPKGIYSVELRTRQRENAERAAHLRSLMLDAVTVTVEQRGYLHETDDPRAIAEANAEYFSQNNIAKFLRDAEDIAKPTPNTNVAVVPASGLDMADDLDLAKVISAILLGTDQEAIDLADIGDVIDVEAFDVSDT